MDNGFSSLSMLMKVKKTRKTPFLWKSLPCWSAGWLDVGCFDSWQVCLIHGRCLRFISKCIWLLTDVIDSVVGVSDSWQVYLIHWHVCLTHSRCSWFLAGVSDLFASVFDSLADVLDSFQVYLMHVKYTWFISKCIWFIAGVFHSWQKYLIHGCLTLRGALWLELGTVCMAVTGFVWDSWQGYLMGSSIHGIVTQWNGRVTWLEVYLELEMEGGGHL